MTCVYLLYCMTHPFLGLSPFIKIIISPIRAYIPTPYLVKVVCKPGMVAHTYNVSIQ